MFCGYAVGSHFKNGRQFVIKISALGVLCYRCKLFCGHPCTGHEWDTIIQGCLTGSHVKPCKSFDIPAFGVDPAHLDIDHLSKGQRGYEFFQEGLRKVHISPISPLKDSCDDRLIPGTGFTGALGRIHFNQQGIIRVFTGDHAGNKDAFGREPHIKVIIHIDIVGGLQCGRSIGTLRFSANFPIGVDGHIQVVTGY